MKLACILNAWDGVELLRYSLASVAPHVDIIIIVYQTISNFGEQFDPTPEIVDAIYACGCQDKTELTCFIPPSDAGFENEIAKRNIGIRIARRHDCTHFFFQDVDECWEDFAGAKQEYIDSGCEGSIAPIYTYFKRPTWRLAEKDNYAVPFIHVLQSYTAAGWPKYGHYVDPTRGVECKTIHTLSRYMHHFSYVRRDIERKCRNSSARANIAKSHLLASYGSPDVGPGYYVTDFRQSLIEVTNLFNIETPWL